MRAHSPHASHDSPASTGRPAFFTGRPRRFHLTHLVAVCLLILGSGSASVAEEGAVPLVGIDHMPLAVNDLQRAADDFRRLGFAIKPGRPHTNGIRNQHIKFPDGAGIELITATLVTDEMTADYVRLMSQGDGAAYASFHTQDLAAVKARLQQLGEPYEMHDSILVFSDPALSWLFIFEGSNRSPTDRPEHFAHANTAEATVALWIASDHAARIRALFKALGARVRRERVYVPGPVEADVARLDGGELILLPGRRQLLPGRPIIGIAMRVRALAQAGEVLRVKGIQPEAGQPPYPRILLAPRHAHGIWLELREQPHLP